MLTRPFRRKCETWRALFSRVSSPNGRGVRHTLARASSNPARNELSNPLQNAVPSNFTACCDRR